MHRPWPSEAIYTLNVILHFPSPVKILQRKQFSKEIATLATFKANVNHVSIEMHGFPNSLKLLTAGDTNNQNVFDTN